jgi:hypothetical protein
VFHRVGNPAGGSDAFSRVDKMLEAAKTLAANTNSAILAKNEAGAVPPAMNTEFKGLVARIYGHAENPGQDFARGRHLPFSAFEAA